MDLIQRNVEKVAEFLKPQMEFLNCHMVDYLTKDYWNAYVPQNIRDELKSIEDLREAKSAFWNQFDAKVFPNMKFSSLKKHILNTRDYQLESLPHAFLGLEDLKEAFDSCLKETRLQIPELMNVKKRHEVESAASIVASLCQVISRKYSEGKSPEEVMVIDAGDGKGYLSSRVALEHGIRVLGIDCNEGNTINAEKRREKLKKKVGKAIKKAELSDDDYFNDLLQNQGSSDPNYKTTTKLIGFDTNLIELVKEKFPNSTANKFCLAGLHTCGNLGPNCVRIFHQNPHVKSLFNVGCCYHLLVEEFVVDKYYNPERLNDNPGYGFPMSRVLKQNKFFIGRNARNLAAESIERVCANQEEPSDKLGYRALLQIVLQQHLGLDSADQQQQVGKLKKCTDFVDYCRKSLTRLKIDHSQLDDAFLRDLEVRYQLQLEQLKIFYLYRMTFAPVIEGLILLDRLLFLKECGYEYSYLVKLFDPVVSPRCFSIVAFK
ncbi:probable methyltransferase-like protein 25 [Uranotaenia lowii]|uniref:probable methyltransferase-like protein 25 n=1 Tax=Uranotaenia lowii TaxID=190385 RepID=UPI002478B617|nr:probable methyltransferase-like protein 25 [Uranotaenia lowii]